MLSRRIFYFICIIGFFYSNSHFSFNKPMNFVTVCDKEHFDWLKLLIKSIKEYNTNKTLNILIFDLGLSQEQISSLTKDPHFIKVCALPLTHPDLKKKFVVRPNGRLARGWYAWKPVALFHAFDHFEYFLYIDAGKRLVRPVDDIFHIILQDGYFLFDSCHTIRPTATKFVIEKFGLNNPDKQYILDSYSIEAGIQGLSLKIFENYIKPMYLLSYDLKNFEDDGSAEWGFGGSRHDQTLFSIFANMLKLKIHCACKKRGRSYFKINNQSIYFQPSFYFGFKRMSDNRCAKKARLI